MSEGERRKLKLRLAAARRLASPLLDDHTKERIEALIRDLEKKLAATPPSRDAE